MMKKNYPLGNTVISLVCVKKLRSLDFSKFVMKYIKKDLFFISAGTVGLEVDKFFGDIFKRFLEIS